MASAPSDALGSPRIAPLILRLAQIGRVLEQQFVDKQEVIQLMLLSAVAGEHLLIVGPPGTAKSALVTRFSQLISARYFEYLLTRFSEPSELLGPLDVQAFREGIYRRRGERLLPTAEVVFLDEIFKANSAILNSLLSLLNERRLHIGSERIDVPLLALFAASNELPSDDSLEALLDRFVLRVSCQNVQGYHFHDLLQRGLDMEQQPSPPSEPLLSADELRSLQAALRRTLRPPEALLATYRDLIFQIRGEGIALSDRRAVRLLKLAVASAFLDGRSEPDAGDLFVLRHAWNSPEQAETLDAIVRPIVEGPRQRRAAGPQVATRIEDILRELARIRDLLRGAAELSDVQLFSQLRALSALRASLSSLPGEAADRALREIDVLLSGVIGPAHAA